MSDRTIELNRIYKHFRGSRYYVDSVAVSADTGKPVVVYHSIDGVSRTYVRDLELFLSEVPPEDREYDTQKYRFELE